MRLGVTTLASFKKRSNGYQGTIYVGRDSEGKQLFEYVTRPTLKECKAATREIEQEIEDGSYVRVGNIRVVAWIEQWLEIHQHQYKPSTRALYQSYLKNHYIPFFDQLKLKELNNMHLKKLLNELLNKMSSTSARRIMSALRPMLYDALKHKSPAKEIKLPREQKVTYKIPNAEEFEQIHNAVKGTNDEPIVLLAGWCGLRRGEIFALRKNDLDFENNIIRIDESYAINENHLYEFKVPKSENGFRSIAAPKELMDLLKPLTQKPKTNDKVIDISSKQDDGEERIFNIRPDNFSSYWAKFVRDKKIPKIRFHDLRHYHATWLHDNNIPDDYAAERLGDNILTLKTIYQHLGLEKKKAFDEVVTKLQCQDRQA